MIDLTKKFYWFNEDLLDDDEGVKIVTSNIMSKDLVKKLELIDDSIKVELDSFIKLKTQSNLINIISNLLEFYGYEKEPENNNVRYVEFNSYFNVMTRVHSHSIPKNLLDKLYEASCNDYKYNYYENTSDINYPTCTIFIKIEKGSEYRINEAFDKYKSIIKL